MKSTYIRNIITFLLYALAILGLLGLFANRIRAALNFPERDVVVENKDSTLLQLLLMPADFSDQFSWYRQWIGQSGLGATSMLGGYYNQYKLDIIQGVFTYEEPPIWGKEGGIRFLGMPDALNDVHDLQGAGRADFQDTECLFNLDDTIICRVKIRDADTAFELEINYDERRNVEAMENILNSVLDAIVKKLK
ncbi:MAG TPA: hypothetical protein VK249_20795 [Anaerolineales bacterium]|nr:hypothetical protein [Anaerolineales bacterium]